MTRIRCISVLLLCLGIGGCNSPFPSEPSATGSIQTPKAVDSSLVQVREEHGYTVIDKSTIVSIDVVVSRLSTHGAQSKERPAIKSEEALHLLSAIQLNAPIEAKPPKGTSTGQIIIHYTDGTQQIDRTYEILNSKYLVDTQYPGTYYTSSTSLDSHWLYNF